MLDFVDIITQLLFSFRFLNFLTSVEENSSRRNFPRTKNALLKHPLSINNEFINEFILKIEVNVWDLECIQFVLRAGVVFSWPCFWSYCLNRC